MDDKTANVRQPSAAMNSTITIALCVVISLVLARDEFGIIGYIAGFSPAAPGLMLDRWIVGLCALVTLGMACLAARGDGVTAPRAFLIGAVSGLGFFACSIGTAIANPEAIDWLLRGNDWTTHYAGWAMFRDAPWAWPPGALPTLMYPRGTAIVFTDSLPALALLFKPFAAWLPDTFQYTGGWFALCLILQGGFGAALAQRWTRNPAIILTSAAFFLYAPVLLNRMSHATLMAQWLLLASLWLYFRPTLPRGVLRETWPWWIVAGIAALTMPYLAAMVMSIVLAYCMRRRWVDHERSTGQALGMLLTTLFLVVALWYLSGAMMLKLQNGNGGVSHGVYSFNLLGFFNSYGWAMLLPALPVASSEQMEGYSYLGLGVIALLAVLLVEAVLRRRRPHWPQQHWPLLATTLVTTAFAASTVLTFGSWILINHPLETPLLSTFRSSGRFIWVAYYLTILGVLVFTLKRFGPTAASVILGCALTAQIWDFTSSHRQAAQLRVGLNWPPPMPSLNDPGWDELAAKRHHFTLVPPEPCGKGPGPLLPFELVAARNHMTFNTAYVARWNPKTEIRYCRQLETQIDSGALSDDELYVVTDEWLQRFQHSNTAPVCRMLDGFRVCVVTSAQASAAINGTR